MNGMDGQGGHKPFPPVQGEEWEIKFIKHLWAEVLHRENMDLTSQLGTLH